MYSPPPSREKEPRNNDDWQPVSVFLGFVHRAIAKAKIVIVGSTFKVYLHLTKKAVKTFFLGSLSLQNVNIKARLY